MLFSVIVPVYNRPKEVDELLKSLTAQTYKRFEILIVEDGSRDDCREIVDKYRDVLEIQYFYKENSGQGFSRNYGFERAKGDFLVVFDSDCIIPAHYFNIVYNYLKEEPVDAWGGPDRAHPDFTYTQKAISYSMTSPFTTGGIRGNKKHYGTFHPRSFNMGISRNVYYSTGGYQITRMGEDLEFSIRILKQGFKTVLIEEAYVYHKRRTNFRQFFRQLHFFGRARVNLIHYHPDEIKTLHLMPAFFVIGATVFLLLSPIYFPLIYPLLFSIAAYAFLIFIHSFIQGEKLWISLLCVIASFTQITAYGTGFLQEWFRTLKSPSSH